MEGSNGYVVLQRCAIDELRWNLLCDGTDSLILSSLYHDASRLSLPANLLEPVVSRY
jgi:hypothetical protein